MTYWIAVTVTRSSSQVVVKQKYCLVFVVETGRTRWGLLGLADADYRLLQPNHLEYVLSLKLVLGSRYETVSERQIEVPHRQSSPSQSCCQNGQSLVVVR